MNDEWGKEGIDIEKGRGGAREGRGRAKGGGREREKCHEKQSK